MQGCGFRVGRFVVDNSSESESHRQTVPINRSQAAWMAVIGLGGAVIMWNVMIPRLHPGTNLDGLPFVLAFLVFGAVGLLGAVGFLISLAE